MSQVNCARRLRLIFHNGQHLRMWWEQSKQKPGGNEQNILSNICWVFCWDVFPHQKKIFYCFPTRGKLCWKMLGCDFPQLLVEGCSSISLIRFKDIESTKIREDSLAMLECSFATILLFFCCFSCGETTTKTSFFMHN